MTLEIVTPEKILFNGEVRLVQVPGSTGPFVMLKNHAPILSILTRGILRFIEENGRERNFEISGGVVENSYNKIVALVELENKAC
jgi:F-type H+-transporting ATPase subunit epsilon